MIDLIRPENNITDIGSPRGGVSHSHYELGNCCEAVMQLRGDLRMVGKCQGLESEQFCAQPCQDNKYCVTSNSEGISIDRPFIKPKGRFSHAF